MARKLLCILAAVAVSLPAVAARAKRPTDPAFNQIDSIVKSLSEITGLSEKRPVPYARMSKRQLRQFLGKRIKKTLKPAEIRADELSLKMFGLVPQNFDLKKSTIDLLTEQAAAFYDYDDKKLFLLEDTSLEAEITTLAHELSHALVDQHFDLAKFMDDESADDDENLARSAVVEGQASWLMLAYDLKRSGQAPVPTPEMLKTVAGSDDDAMGDYPVLKSSPLYIQQSLLFPYAQGIEFFDAVYRREGKQAFAAVFRTPPDDSAQILHPDRYFAHEKAAKPELPKLANGEHQAAISEGSVGEFDHEILIRQYIDKKHAEALAPHLRGGNYRVVGLGKMESPCLLYASEWDSAASAAEFFADYAKVLSAKWKHFDPVVRQEELLAGQGDTGYFVTRRNGAVVSSVEGLMSRSEWDNLRTGEATGTPHTLATPHGSQEGNDSSAETR